MFTALQDLDFAELISPTKDALEGRVYDQLQKEASRLCYAPWKSSRLLHGAGWESPQCIEAQDCLQMRLSGVLCAKRPTLRDNVELLLHIWRALCQDTQPLCMCSVCMVLIIVCKSQDAICPCSRAEEAERLYTHELSVKEYNLDTMPETNLCFDNLQHSGKRARRRTSARRNRPRSAKQRKLSASTALITQLQSLHQASLPALTTVSPSSRSLLL